MSLETKVVYIVGCVFANGQIALSSTQSVVQKPAIAFGNQVVIGRVDFNDITLL